MKNADDRKSPALGLQLRRVRLALGQVRGPSSREIAALRRNIAFSEAVRQHRASSLERRLNPSAIATLQGKDQEERSPHPTSRWYSRYARSESGRL